jgi:hypothetical protein
MKLAVNGLSAENQGRQRGAKNFGNLVTGPIAADNSCGRVVGARRTFVERPSRGYVCVHDPRQVSPQGAKGRNLDWHVTIAWQ